jgi:hypothetical protein
MKIKQSFLCSCLVTLFITLAQADEIGHYGPGVANIRDYAMPAPGFYGVMYNYGYTTDQLNDDSGNEIDSITLGRGDRTATVDVDIDVDIYVLAPTFIWVSDWTLLGAKYGAFITPTFGNSSVGATLSRQSGAGRDIESGQFNIGDIFVQPLWFGWSEKHWDITIGYGFYAPLGRYNTETINLPVLGARTVESSDNIGLGFWTHQFQGGVTWYPWESKGTAINTALTYEIHGEKRDFNITPGQNLTLNWGVSQFLPLSSNEKLLLEVGPAGYSSWQVSNDTGSDAAPPRDNDQVHAVGGQVGLAYVPWETSLNLRYFYEVEAKDRFQGESLGLNLAAKF